MRSPSMAHFWRLFLVFANVLAVSGSLSKMTYSRPEGSVSSADSHSKTPSKRECQFPRLRQRLMKMISEREVEAFEIILHTECKNEINPSHPNFVSVFESLLEFSLFQDVDRFLLVLLRDFGATYSLFAAWIGHRRLVRVNVLRILSRFLKNPNAAMIYSLSLRYPTESRERKFLNRWLLKIQGPQMKWPFSPPSSPRRGLNAFKKPNSRIKRSKSFAAGVDKSNEASARADPTAVAAEDEFVMTTSDDDKNSHNCAIDSKNTLPPSPPAKRIIRPFLNFGHIYGWSNASKRTFVKNDKRPGTICGKSVLLGNRFLGFASSTFSLEEFAKSRSFFGTEHRNAALKQKVRSRPGVDFSAVTIIQNTLHAVFFGDLAIVVLGRVEENGRYDFKYPVDPYAELLRQPITEDLSIISLDVQDSDIVLLLPRAIFTSSEGLENLKIFPHDLPGAFHYTDLPSFALNFLNFVNYVHLKTSHVGLVSAAGFIHQPI